MNQRTRTFAALAAALFLLALTACGGSNFDGDFSYEVQDFSYVNQNSEKVSLDDLKGKPWLADFVFTNCNTVCPPMTANMSRIQEKLKKENIDMQIVSFSVDPEVDTPETLKAFGDKFDADYDSWHFLTGYDQEEIVTLARKSFKTLVQNDPSSDQVIHGTSFYLVDQEGNAVKSYDGLDVPYEEIIDDAKAITK
ncbi:SCO family protein [Bacillus marinisedimentorum]|uniref:SCO family protein n=1 Tax=Bacillus marinisedimentorum TaxID=1821260 RepID=UPI0008723D76|nr:SCO family protein [Bacillus marinisedimentorum]